MVKPPKKLKPEEIETEPGAWERFEKTIGKILPPKPHKTGKNNVARNDKLKAEKK